MKTRPGIHKVSLDHQKFPVHNHFVVNYDESSKVPFAESPPKKTTHSSTGNSSLFLCFFKMCLEHLRTKPALGVAQWLLAPIYLNLPKTSLKSNIATQNDAMFEFGDI